MTNYILQLHDVFVCVTASFLRHQNASYFNIIDSEAFL